MSSAFLLKHKTMILNKHSRKEKAASPYFSVALSISKEQENFLMIGLRTWRIVLKSWLMHKFFKPL